MMERGGKMRPRAHGFTLIEVIVAISILAVMTLMTATAIRSAIQARAKATGLMQREALVRDALRVIERDVNSAFHYREISLDAPAAGQPATAGTVPGAAAPVAPVAPAAPVDPNKKQQITAFMGENERMDFTALSHVRTSADAPESDQVEIGYYVAACKARTRTGTVDTSCLWRRESNDIDDDPTKGGQAVALVEHVEQFKLRYLGPDKEEWQDSWKTYQGGDDTTKDRFPYAVEVTLKVFDKTDPNAKPVSMTMTAEIRFPNNAPKADSTQQQPQPQQPQAPAQPVAPSKP